MSYQNITKHPPSYLDITKHNSCQNTKYNNVLSKHHQVKQVLSKHQTQKKKKDLTKISQSMSMLHKTPFKSSPTNFYHSEINFTSQTTHLEKNLLFTCNVEKLQTISVFIKFKDKTAQIISPKERIWRFSIKSLKKYNKATVYCLLYNTEIWKLDSWEDWWAGQRTKPGMVFLQNAQSSMQSYT